MVGKDKSCSGLKSLDIAAQLIHLQSAEVCLFDIALGAYDHGKWQAAGLIAELPGKLGARHSCYIKRVSDFIFGGKLANIARGVDAYSQYLDAFRCQFRLQRGELGHFFYTGRTPGGPKINDERFALPLREFVYLAIGIRHFLRKQGGYCSGFRFSRHVMLGAEIHAYPCKQ